MDPVGSIEGPRLVMEPMGVSFCLPRVPHCVFLCLEWKSMADIADFLCGAYLPPPELEKVLIVPSIQNRTNAMFLEFLPLLTKSPEEKFY